MKNPIVRIQKLLNKPLPSEALLPDPQSGLTNISSAFEIERLNQVFGVNGWNCEYIPVNLDREKGEICIKASFFAGDIRREAFGGNDNYRLGDALKGACTDALGKVCYQLGIGLEVYKTRNDFRLEKDGAPKDTGKPQYTSISGIVTQVYLNGGDKGIWVQVNGQTCYAPKQFAERIGVLTAYDRIALNAKWWWPDGSTAVLLVTGILDIEPIMPMKVPEIIEKRTKRSKNGQNDSVSPEITQAEAEAR